MAKEKSPRRAIAKDKAPREVEGSAAAPEPDEAEHSSVKGNDIREKEVLQTETVGAGGVDDPWVEPMKDLARLVLAAYEVDPHRFDGKGRK